MDTFKRYLLHFTLIGIAIILCLAILVFLTELKNTNFKVLITGAVMILVFSLLMAMSFAELLAKNQEIIVKFNNDNEKANIISNLDSFALKKANRKDKVIANNTILYTYNSSYSRWLTNPIRVEIFDDYIKINLPKAYNNGVLKILPYSSKIS